MEVKMDERILKLSNQINDEVASITSVADIENVRVKYLGKKGQITDLRKLMKDLSVEEKKSFGQEVNDLKDQAQEKITSKMEELKQKELEAELNAMPDFDISIPADLTRGSYHPITLVQRECERIFKSMGFSVEDYSEIVSDYECFESLNIPKHHPARDMQDTYYLENGQLLKSQTSAAQNAIYKKYKDSLVNEGKTIKSIFPGRCFRNEATDASHEHTFYQIEGIYVDEAISMGNMQATIKEYLEQYLETDLEIKMQPAYFPFTEPDVEFVISCPFCNKKGCSTCANSGWIELMGCGMIHPNVLKQAGIDPEKYSGFAWGFGVDRLTMIKLGIHDIRYLRDDNLNFLRQF